MKTLKLKKINLEFYIAKILDLDGFQSGLDDFFFGLSFGWYWISLRIGWFELGIGKINPYLKRV